MSVPPLLIAGAPRSGTSATARLLAHSGLDVAEQLMPAHTHNELGFYEDLTFNALNRELFDAGLPPGTERPEWVFGDCIDPARLVPLRPRVAAAVARRGALGVAWGFKDPRTAMLLDFYADIAPEARHLFVYRPPWDVVDSLLRLTVRPFRGRADLAVRGWLIYAEAMLAWHERHPDCGALVHIDAVRAAPGAVVDRVQQLLAAAGAPPLAGAPDVPAWEDTLFTRRPADAPLAEVLRLAAPEVETVYARLEAAADLPSAAAATGPPPASVPAADAHPSGVFDVVTLSRGGAGAAPTANAAIAGGDAPYAIVGFGATVAPDGLDVAAARLGQGACAVLMTAGGRLPNTPDELLATPEGWSVIAVERAAWAAVGGFDSALPPSGLHAWELAVAIAASGRAVVCLEGPVSAVAPVDWAERERGVRHVLARDPAFTARHLGWALHHTRERLAELDRGAG